MRSLPDIANERVKSLTSSISSIREDVVVKGFLGPSIRENNALPSVGHRAARRAGIIVDDNGKMRCPPGTPNANQFTDMQMSNCMVPSPETVARASANTVSSFLPPKTSPKTVEEFKALGIDIDTSLTKQGLSQDQKNLIGKIALNSAYWATFFGNFGDLGSVINDVTTGIGDSDQMEGIQMLTSIYVSGGVAAIKNALELARTKWNHTREQVQEYQDAFVARMDRLKVRAGQLGETMGNALLGTLDSVKKRIANIDPFEQLNDAKAEPEKGIAAFSSLLEPFSPDILANVGVKDEDLRGDDVAQILLPENPDTETYSHQHNEQKRLRTALYER